MAKKFNAYKPVKMTDGIQTWIDHRFDMTAMTPDDFDAFHAIDNSPEFRIKEMAARLDTLAVTTPAIAAHVAEIRAIHDRVRPMLGRLKNEHLDLLKQADHMWSNIMVLRDMMPRAAKGVAYGKAQADRRKDKPATDPDHDPGRNDRIRAFHARLHGERDATSKTALEFELSTRSVRRILNS